MSIADEDEYKFVRKLLSGDQWLGAIRLRQDNGCGAEHWKWSDDTPWVWYKWQDGEPKNVGGTADRVQMSRKHLERSGACWTSFIWSREI